MIAFDDQLSAALLSEYFRFVVRHSGNQNVGRAAHAIRQRSHQTLRSDAIHDLDIRTGTHSLFEIIKGHGLKRHRLHHAIHSAWRDDELSLVDS